MTTDVIHGLNENVEELHPEESEKKKTISEIGVFLLITFGISLSLGWYAYPDADTEMTGLNMLFYYIVSFSPAIGCIATRYIFREGFRDDILFPKFTGNFKWYFLSVLLPILFGIIACIFITTFLGAGFTIKTEGGALEVAATIAFYSIQFYPAFFILIGEELGWRAFLYDKLEVLLGLHGSVIIGGILWGLWHIPPLITIGLNFGKDAPGYPITNILLMCVFCIFGGVMLQLLRKKTDSVIAPIIAHAVIDTVCNPLMLMFLSQEFTEGKNFQMGLCMTVAMILVGIPCWVCLGRGVKPKRDKI